MGTSRFSSARIRAQAHEFPDLSARPAELAAERGPDQESTEAEEREGQADGTDLSDSCRAGPQTGRPIVRPRLRSALIWLSGLLGLGLLTAVLVLNLLVPKVLQGEIEKLASERLGREVSIQGGLELGLFPRLSLDLQGLALANQEGFAAEHLARIEYCGVRLRWLPLLTGEVQLDSLQLRNISVNLAKNRQGRTNWTTLTESVSDFPPARSRGQKKGSLLQRFMVRSFDLHQASVTWTDRTTGAELELKDLDLSAGPFKPGQAFSFQTGFRLVKGDSGLAAGISGSGRVLVHLEAAPASILDLDLDCSLNGRAVPGGSGRLSRRSGVWMDVEGGRAGMEQFSLEAFGLDLTGSAQVEGLQQRPDLKGTVTVKEFSPRRLFKRLDRPLPPMGDGQTLGRAHAKLEFTLTPQAWEISELSGRLDETFISGRIAYEQLDGPRIDWAVHLDELNLDRYLPAQTSDESVESGKSRFLSQLRKGLPLQHFWPLEIKGRLDIGRLRVRGFRLQNIGLTLSMRNGLLAIGPVKDGVIVADEAF